MLRGLNVLDGDRKVAANRGIGHNLAVFLNVGETTLGRGIIAFAPSPSRHSVCKGDRAKVGKCHRIPVVDDPLRALTAKSVGS